VVTLFPNSKWAGDARSHIQAITRREISLDTMGAQPPGKNAKLNINTRNLKQIRFAAYRVKLEDVLTRPKNLNNPETSFTQFSENFGSIATAIEGRDRPDATWNVTTKDKGDYKGVNETIDTPLQDLGAYVIVATSGNLRFARVLIISDLMILKKTDRDGAFAFVADAPNRPANSRHASRLERNLLSRFAKNQRRARHK
jgi:hypothetical protein